MGKHSVENHDHSGPTWAVFQDAGLCQLCFGQGWDKHSRLDLNLGRPLRAQIANNCAPPCTNHAQFLATGSVAFVIRTLVGLASLLLGLEA